MPNIGGPPAAVQRSPWRIANSVSPTGRRCSGPVARNCSCVSTKTDETTLCPARSRRNSATPYCPCPLIELVPEP